MTEQELVLTGVPCADISKEEIESDGAGERVPRPCECCGADMWVGPRGLAMWDRFARRWCMRCLIRTGELDDQSQLNVMMNGEYPPGLVLEKGDK